MVKYAVFWPNTFLFSYVSLFLEYKCTSENYLVLGKLTSIQLLPYYKQNTLVYWALRTKAVQDIADKSFSLPKKNQR